MSSRVNILYHGPAGAAAEELERTDYAHASEQYLRLALINALRRIEHLEQAAMVAATTPKRGLTTTE